MWLDPELLARISHSGGGGATQWLVEGDTWQK